MPLVNESKPTTTLTNTGRPSTGLTWGEATMTWAAQTDTWGGTASLIDNSSRVSSSITNVSRPA